MEKPAGKSKYKFWKLLKEATAVNFQNPPFSPGRDKNASNENKLKSHMNKGYSGPIISIIPAEARSKSKNSGFEAQEPTSPKVSCMGQIKHRKKLAKNKHASIDKDYSRTFSFPDGLKNGPSHDQVMKKSSGYESKNGQSTSTHDDVEKKSTRYELKNRPSHADLSRFEPLHADVVKKSSGFLSIFRNAKTSGKSHDFEENPRIKNEAPSLGQMKRFASGRESLANFDWTKAQIAPESMDERRYYSDEEKEDSFNGEEEDEVIIPFSAPILVGGGGTGLSLEPRKEISLWKRRTMTQPRPLNLDVSY